MTTIEPTETQADTRRASTPNHRPHPGLLFQRKSVIGLGGTAVFLIALALVHEPILLGMGDFLVVNEDELQPADMIQVLGGRLERVDHGVQLYQQGYGRKLFIHDCSHSTNRQRAIANGARPEDIVPGLSHPTSTYEEAVALKEFLASDPAIQSVIIVSSPYHMRRVYWAFNKVLGDRVALQFAAVPFELSQYQHHWWTDARSATAAMSEYLKNLYYYLKYGSS